MSLLEKTVRYTTVYRISSHLIFWLAILVIITSRHNFYAENPIPLANVLIMQSFDVGFYMIASYFIAYGIIPRLFDGTHYFLILIYFLAGSYICCVFFRTMVVHVLEPMVRKRPFSQESIFEILTDLTTLTGGYFLRSFPFAFIFSFFKLIKGQYLVQQEALLLEKEKTASELKILKAQLNPHFLFNTLNNIYALSVINSPITSKSISGLSEILDHVLYRCNEQYVSLSAEIALLKNYIELEKLRYDDRLQVNFKHTIDHDMQIAPLILLSLTENAFKHGAGEDIGNPTINIDLKLQQNQFQFMISNTFKPGSADPENERIGLDNIRKQLELIYPGHYDFRLSTNDDIFVALLKVELDKGINFNKYSNENQVLVGR